MGVCHDQCGSFYLDAMAHPDVGVSNMSLAQHAILQHRADTFWLLQVFVVTLCDPLCVVAPIRVSLSSLVSCFLAYCSTVLLLFTHVYNVFFLLVASAY